MDIFQIAIAFLAGMVVMSLLFLLGLRNIRKDQDAREAERERKDPSNWWKYGKDPYEHEEYNDE